MADVFSKAKRSEVMSKIRSKDTKPEIMVRKFLFSQGFRYRKYSSSLPGKPDIILPKYKTVVFINGCFWHGHICKEWSLKKPYWKQKIGGNMARDKRNARAIRALGWKVIVVWECQILKKGSSTLPRLVEKIIG